MESRYTLIKMKVGYKKIKDIKIGDLIHNGNTVIGKIKQKPINQKVCKIGRAHV